MLGVEQLTNTKVSSNQLPIPCPKKTSSRFVWLVQFLDPVQLFIFFSNLDALCVGMYKWVSKSKWKKRVVLCHCLSSFHFFFFHFDEIRTSYFDVLSRHNNPQWPAGAVEYPGERWAVWSSCSGEGKTLKTSWNEKSATDFGCLVESGPQSSAAQPPTTNHRVINSSVLLAAEVGRPSSLLASGFHLIISSQHGDSVEYFLCLL